MRFACGVLRRGIYQAIAAHDKALSWLTIGQWSAGSKLSSARQLMAVASC